MPRQQRRRHAAPTVGRRRPRYHPDHARQRRGAAASDAAVRDRRRPVHGRRQRRSAERGCRGPPPPAPCTTSPVTHKRRSTKTIGTQVTWPALSLAFTANPPTGIVPLNVRFDYLLTNTSRTDVPMSNVEVDQRGLRRRPPCQRRHRQRRLARHGRVVAVQLLAPVHDGDDLRRDRARLGHEHRRHAHGHLAPGPGGRRPPRSVAAGDDADPQRLPHGRYRAAEAPSTPTPCATRAPRMPRPIADVTIDDPTCMSVTRTQGDDLLERDETWTFTPPPSSSPPPRPSSARRSRSGFDT